MIIRFLSVCQLVENIIQKKIQKNKKTSLSNRRKLLTFSVLSLLSCGLLAVSITFEVPNRHTEFRKRSLLVDAVFIHVLVRQIGDSRTSVPGADGKRWRTKLLCIPGTTGFSPVIVSCGEDVFDGEGRKA